VTNLYGYAQDQHGAEMVEWVVVVVVLSALASIMFGPTGVLSNAVTGALGKISAIINALP
jgi:Flp pilus assembly pilin Flp